MTTSYSESVAADDDQETGALGDLAGGLAYVFLTIDTEEEPAVIRLVCGNGPETADDIDLMLRAALRQLQLARES